jgi:NAD(P)-dependent dehydrogenase (short-subunit alcohol dehydrogenase family)
MTGTGQRVAIITGASRGIGAGLVAGYRAQGWAVVANSVTIKPSDNPGVLTVEGDAFAPLAKLHPMGRVGQVSDVVGGILYLESAPFVTGEILHIDGGQSAGR